MNLKAIRERCDNWVQFTAIERTNDIKALLDYIDRLRAAAEIVCHKLLSPTDEDIGIIDELEAILGEVEDG